MQSREASHSSKSNQHSASVPVSNLFPTRPFGVPTQTESIAENTGLDEATSHPSLDFSHIAVSAPGTPPPEPPPSPSPLTGAKQVKYRTTRG